VVRSRAQVLGLENEFYQKHDVHLHIPEGRHQGRPKRGHRHVHRIGVGADEDSGALGCGHDGRDHAAWRVLPIGGLKEKLLAAHRGGIKTVLIPDENQKDLVEIPDNIKAALRSRR